MEYHILNNWECVEYAQIWVRTKCHDVMHSFCKTRLSQTFGAISIWEKPRTRLGWTIKQRIAKIHISGYDTKTPKRYHNNIRYILLYHNSQPQKPTTVAQHFNMCPSPQPAGFDSLEISILSFIKSPSNSKAGQVERDREEKRWIHSLATVVPKGLNLILWIKT